MLSIFKKVRTIFASLTVTLIVFSPVMAEDTEIYVGNNQGVTEVKPNILFVVDTSGSMNSLVTTQEVYDPAVTYPDPDGCFDDSRVYWKTGTNATSCNTNNYFDLSALKCKKALDNFAVTGVLNDRFGEYRSNRWRDIDSGSKGNYIECQDDAGIHGIDDASAAKRARDGGPWTTSTSNDINWWWRKTYTVSSANYERWQRSIGGSTRQRLEIVKDAINDLVNSMVNVNIGLMRFDSSSNGGMVVTPMKEIAEAKTDFLHELYRMYPSGGTPLAKSLYEAALYYKSGKVDYGDSSGERAYNLAVVDTPWTGGYTGSGYYADPATGSTYSNSYNTKHSHPDSTNGSNYKSPIEFECQKNYVVFLTDGEPSSTDSLSDGQRASIGAKVCSTKYEDNGGTMRNHCLPQIAEAMATIDQNTVSLDGDQTVQTYTIGFATDQVLLKDAAQKGNGAYETADDAASLAVVFNKFITSIKNTSATFSSPAVSVNAFNRTSHRSDLYFTLFKPSEGPHWHGNFKRYKLAFKADGSPDIVGADNQSAVDPNTGFFKETAESYWTPSVFLPDGKEAHMGGAASRLSNDRKIYTNLSSGDLLTDGNNRVHENNTGYLTLSALGLPAATPAADRTHLLQWVRGIDVDDDDGDGATNDARVIMGDPLHAQPALIQYDGPEADPEIIAYVATNDGLLHAIDTRNAYGEERYAFIPKELLTNLNTQYVDDLNEKKLYGLDGSVVAWVNDVDQDGTIEPADGDHAYIYFGMRRGGNNIYALDVTDKNNPKRLWTDNVTLGTTESIKGGTGDFAELGQTWSRPVLRKIRVNGTDTYVLVFAGGYDPTQDASSLRSVDSIGRAVYMVNAKTGKRIWWASSDAAASTAPNVQLTEMKYSMPADVAAIDANADGYLDVVYAADMGGQIFRFDFPGSEVNNAKGGRIAELAADTAGGKDSRRFYYPPDVSIIKNRDRTSSLALVINSGYRAHPNDLDIDDRVYMIRDRFPVSSVAPTYSTLTESDLFDTTDNLIGDGTAAEKTAATVALKGKKGWYINLEGTGEKGLGTPFIFDNMVFISAFQPSVAGTSTTCEPAEGSSNLYVMSLFDGQPALNSTMVVDDPSNLDKADRKIDLNQSGIGGDPRLIMQPNQNDVICVGTECMGISGMGQLRSEYWFEQ